MTEIEKTLGMDSFAVFTRNPDEFATTLHEISCATEWREIVPSAVKLYGFTPGEYKEAVNETINSTRDFILSNFMDRDLAEDTMNGSRMFVDFGDGTTPVFLRNTAIASTCARAGLQFMPRLRKALTSSNPDAMAETLNVGLAINTGKPMKVCICAGKVNAMLSPSYNILGNERVIEIAKETLAEKFGELEFQDGYITHGSVTAAYTMPESTNEFVDKYLTAVENTNGVYQVDSVVPAVKIQTSDCGECAATVVPRLYVNGHPRTFLKPIKSRHIGEVSVSLQAWKKTCASLYAKMDETVEMVEKMAHTDIYFPMNTIQNLCKTVKLPEKWLLAAKECHKRFGTEACTMLDIYYSINEAIDGAADKKKVSLEEKVARILLLEWQDYDTSVVMD